MGLWESPKFPLKGSFIKGDIRPHSSYFGLVVALGFLAGPSIGPYLL